MKLLELEIDGVRGIQHLLLKPNGHNVVVWGPNGSGKSAVVDAIDFLLTGRILRLTGSGTGCLSLSKHGPHVDCDPERSLVRGVFQLPGHGTPVELKRSMAEPKNLQCTGADVHELDDIFRLADQGVHILGRREILRYITAESSTRAQQIQELLSITQIEETRRALVRVKNDAVKNLQAAQKTLGVARARVSATTQDQEYDAKRVLEVVNQNRSLLGASVIEALRSGDVKKDVNAPRVVLLKDDLNTTILRRDIQNLTDVMTTESQTRIGGVEESLNELVAKITADPELIRALGRVDLLTLGMRMVDETGKCPLCDTEWPPGKLLEYLARRIEVAKTAGQYREKLGHVLTMISPIVNRTIASLQKVAAAAQMMAMENDLVVLKLWLDRLQQLSALLTSPIETYLRSTRADLQLKRTLAPENITEVLTDVEKALCEKYPESTPEQTAWDTLTRIAENLKGVESAEGEEKLRQLCAKRAGLLHDRFLSARDRVLGDLYAQIKNRFVVFYQELHSDDEKGFSATIQPEEAGLNFTVDFYGRGSHPPHALHSEGHQDSMGLCLFLALAEHLTTGLIDLIVLDDVVMSVDAGHRKRVCGLVAKHFHDRQFLITTHDRTWANQLKGEGVVDSRGTIEFYDWSLELGPQVNSRVDLWSQIKNDMESNAIPTAAHRLRRGCEEFFGQVCDSLRAPVRYRLDGRWELGDLLGPAMGQYRDLLKKAKNATQSWGDKDSIQKLQEIESIASQVFNRCQAEHWTVNASVHYNNWASLGKGDFQPVVEAFADLCGLFMCPKCSTILYVATKGLDSTSLRCNCGAVNWNLVPNKKA